MSRMSIIHFQSDMQLTINDILMLLSIVAVAMLIILLYHLIFTAVSLRKLSQRLDDLSEDVESIILKPLGAIDYMIDWFLAVVENMRGGDEIEEEDTKKKHKE